MLDKTVLQAEQVWPSVAKILYVSHNEAEYDRLVEVLDQLIDQIGGDEDHPLASLPLLTFHFLHNTHHWNLRGQHGD